MASSPSPRREGWDEDGRVLTVSWRRAVALAGVFCALFSPEAQAQLQWRVSVKVILDANTNRPTSGNVYTDSQIQGEINTANAILDKYGRGYDYVLTEIVDLPGVSQWYSVDSRDANNKANLESAALNDKATYAYRDDAINVYINGSTDTSVCSFPGGGNIILTGQGAYLPTIAHESGHYFDLHHTQDGESAGCTNCNNTCAPSTDPCNDLVCDTLPDTSCWNQDQIAQYSYGTTYANLNAGQQSRVDDVYHNLMSYHDPDNRNRLTPDQLDRMTDTSNGGRNNVASGHTRFVDRNCSSPFANGSSACSFFGGPYSSVGSGINAANPGDIVMVRPGNYNEPMTISKPVTLRATRGNATIGVP